MSARFNMKMMGHCNRQILIGAFNRNPRSESKFGSTPSPHHNSLNQPIRFHSSPNFNCQSTKYFDFLASTNHQLPRFFPCVELEAEELPPKARMQKKNNWANSKLQLSEAFSFSSFCSASELQNRSPQNTIITTSIKILHEAL